MTDKTILQEAQDIAYGARHTDYGHPLDNFIATAKIWSVILGQEVTPVQVGLCMIGVKLARETYRGKRDNLVDIAGYADTVQRTRDELYKRTIRTETFAPLEELPE